MDGYAKLETFLDRCITHNVKLKFSKSWIGFNEVNFFGYHCTHKSFKLTDERKQAIMKMPFPTDGNRCKKMRVALVAVCSFRHSCRTIPLRPNT